MLLPIKRLISFSPVFLHLHIVRELAPHQPRTSPHVTARVQQLCRTFRPGPGLGEPNQTPAVHPQQLLSKAGQSQAVGGQPALPLPEPASLGSSFCHPHARQSLPVAVRSSAMSRPLTCPPPPPTTPTPPGGESQHTPSLCFSFFFFFLWFFL